MPLTSKEIAVLQKSTWILAYAALLGIRICGKVEKVFVHCRKNQRNTLSPPFPSTGNLQSHAGTEISCSLKKLAQNKNISSSNAYFSLH